MQIPRHSSDKFKIRDESPVYLTEEGFNQLKDRHAQLKKNLPEYIADAQRTAAEGDRSDNAGYKEAKSLLRRTHRQILTIEDKLKRVVVIKSGLNAAGTVQLGSTVILELSDGSASSPQAGKPFGNAQGKQKTYEIVGSEETKPERGRISHKSPLGAALLNHKKGEVVNIKTPNGTTEYKIIEVS